MANGVSCISLPARRPGAVAADRGARRRPAEARTFVSGDENRLVEAAVAAFLAEEPTTYNPLVFYGPSGSGKTLLAEGLASEYERRHPQARVVCVTAADFARDFSASFDEQPAAEFRRRYRGARLLAVDDLGQLAGKQPAQQALVHTLDAVLARGGRVIGTLRHAPRATFSLLPGLRDRLSAGLTIPLALPGLLARQLILRELARARGLALSDSAAELLAAELPLSATELSGALISLAATGEEIDEAAVREHLASRHPGPPADLRRIALATARQFDLTLADLKGPSRTRSVALARGAAMLLARTLTDVSLQRIGAYFGGRDHTTVLHACRTTEATLSGDAAAQQAVHTIRRKLGRG